MNCKSGLSAIQRVAPKSSVTCFEFTRLRRWLMCAVFPDLAVILNSTRPRFQSFFTRSESVMNTRHDSEAAANQTRNRITALGRMLHFEPMLITWRQGNSKREFET